MKTKSIVKYILIGLAAVLGTGTFLFNRLAEKGELSFLDIFAAIFTTIVYSVVIVLMFTRKATPPSTNNDINGGNMQNQNRLSKKDINRLSQ